MHFFLFCCLYDLTCTPHSLGSVQVARPTTFSFPAVAELYQMVMQEAGMGWVLADHHHRELHPPQLTKFLEPSGDLRWSIRCSLSQQVLYSESH